MEELLPLGAILSPKEWKNNNNLCHLEKEGEVPAQPSCIAEVFPLDPALALVES